MLTFFCRLNPPRPTFAHDMTPEEGALMQQHADHWRAAMTRGQVVAFGLVGDPAGPFGIGILQVEDDAAAQTFTNADPVVQSARGFRYDILPMPFGVVHPGA
jgi:uncharacterized protein YciI